MESLPQETLSHSNAVFLYSARKYELYRGIFCWIEGLLNIAEPNIELNLTQDTSSYQIKLKHIFVKKNDLHYRAHTCKYIGISQTASQNRTKDTKIIQKNIHIKSEIAVWRKLFICSWWVLIPLQNTYRLEDESLSMGILGNYVFFGACSEKLCLFELKNT